MHIRRAHPKDLPGIYRVEKASFPDPWPLFAFLPYLVHGGALAFVAVEDGVVGYILAVRNGAELHIHNLAVSPEHRRQGIGSALLKRLFAECPGLRRARLEVRASNAPARRFYEKHGFQVAAVLPGYYSDGEDGILMLRELWPPGSEGEGTGQRHRGQYHTAGQKEPPPSA